MIPIAGPVHRCSAPELRQPGRPHLLQGTTRWVARRVTRRSHPRLQIPGCTEGPVSVNESEYLDSSSFQSIWIESIQVISEPTSDCIKPSLHEPTWILDECRINCSGLIKPTWKRAGLALIHSIPQVGESRGRRGRREGRTDGEERGEWSVH